MADEESGVSAELLDKTAEILAGLLAELGACPPMQTACPQRGKPINIAICSTCIRGWAEVKAKGD
ncbi:MAG: hypothetical protein ACYS47_08340 [Planctomycetota bacterium]|jgi:hypothetical protein